MVVVVAGAAAWEFGRAPAAVSYGTAPVTRGDVSRSVNASGSVNPQTTVQVGSYVSGSIQAVNCDYNTQVKKGQLCAKIDPRPYQSTVDQDQANLKAAQAQLNKDATNLQLTKSTNDRTAELFEQQLVSQDQFDQTKAAYQQAVAQVQVDQSAVTQHAAALKSSQVNLDYTNITSPVDGTVVSRNVTVGQTVASSFQTPTLFLIATDLTKMEVDASVSESDIGGITQGAAATFTVEAFPDRRFSGVVTQVRQSPQTVQNVVTYDVVLSAPNLDLVLKPGMTANVQIVVDRRQNVLRVPDQALRYVPGGIAGATPGTTGAAGSPARGNSARGSGSSSSEGARAGGGRGANATGRSAGAGGGARAGGSGGAGFGGGGAPSGSTGGTNHGTVYVLRNGSPVAVPVTTGLDDNTYTEVTGNLSEGEPVVVSEQSASGNANSTTPSQGTSRLRMRF